MNVFLKFWFYGSALIFVGYWSVVFSQFRRGVITARDLRKGVLISLLAILLWPYLLARWLWMLLSGDLTREIILDPLDASAEGAQKPEDET